MVDYTGEPPRRECLLHLPFDVVSGDAAIDTSPQANDGEIVGGPETVTGQIGEGLYFSGDQRVEADVDVDATDTYTVSAHIKVGEDERGDRLDISNPIIADDQTNWALHMDASGQFTDEDEVAVYIKTEAGSFRSFAIITSREEWHHIVAVRDGTDAKIYVDGQLVQNTTVDADLFDPASTIYIGGGTDGKNLNDTAVDEPRVYDRALSKEEVVGLYGVSNELNAISALKQVWDNDGIPFRGNNIRLAGALAENSQHALRQLDWIRESHHIDDAAGEQLDDIGRVAGISRKENERDAKYRARIKGRLVAGRSSGTFDDIIRAAATVVETSIDRIELQTDFSVDQATCQVYLRTADLNDAELTITEVTEILKDVVIAGHDIEVIEQGSDPFTVRSDTQANDPDLGLTSDSISTGGGLVSDT
jgi:hypothetical protein